MSFPGFPGPPPPPGTPPNPTTHNLLSATHADTTPAAVVNGAIVVAISGSWRRVLSGAELDHLVIVGGIPTWSAQVGSGLGDVTGPGSATDNAIARYNQTTGKLIQNSLALILDDGTIITEGDLFASGDLTVLGLSILNQLNVVNNFNVGGDTVISGSLTVLGPSILNQLDVVNNFNVGGNTTISGDINVLGDIIGINLAASGALTGAPGDILYATGIDQFGNLSIGADGEILTAVGGVPTWAAASGGAGAGGPVPVTIETSATVTITNSDYFVALSGTTTVNLPAAPDNGQRHVIKDSLGVAASTPITIDGNGFPIDDLVDTSLINNYESATLVFVSALGQWQLV